MDFPYSLTDIAFITDGILVSEKIDPVRVRELLIDSRRLVHPESTIFIALTSVRNDGHRYIPELPGFLPSGCSRKDAGSKVHPGKRST